MNSKFKPMLAVDHDPKKLKFPYYLSPKLDGIRCLCDAGQALSRSLKLIPNKHVQAGLSHMHLSGLDGEVICGDVVDPNSMQNTTSGVMSFDGTPEFTYWVFDIHSYPDYPYEQRWAWLRQGQESLEANFPFVRVVPHHIVNTIEQLDAAEAHYLKCGYEGVMLRSPDGHYKYGRSTVNQNGLLKVKRFIDGEAEIIGFEEAMENGNVQELDNLGYAKRSTSKHGMIPKNVLGAFVCRDLKTNIMFNIGTGRGMTLAFRRDVWKERDKYLGKILKYKSQELGVRTAPRIPIGHGFRDPIDM